MKKETCHCIESAYKKGYDIAIAENEDRLAQAKQEGYDKGLEDAWECARYMRELSFQDFNKIFDEKYVVDAIKHCSASEAMTKIREYEEKQNQTERCDIPSDEMTEEQLRQAVKDLRKEICELKYGRAD